MIKLVNEYPGAVGGLGGILIALLNIYNIISFSTALITALVFLLLGGLAIVWGTPK